MASCKVLRHKNDNHALFTKHSLCCISLWTWKAWCHFQTEVRTLLSLFCTAWRGLDWCNCWIVTFRIVTKLLSRDLPTWKAGKVSISLTTAALVDQEAVQLPFPEFCFTFCVFVYESTKCCYSQNIKYYLYSRATGSLQTHTSPWMSVRKLLQDWGSEVELNV